MVILILDWTLWELTWSWHNDVHVVSSDCGSDDWHGSDQIPNICFVSNGIAAQLATSIT